MKFTSRFDDFEINIDEYGWADIIQPDRQRGKDIYIGLGVYPNARWEAIEKALEHLKGLTTNGNEKTQ